MGPKAVCLAVVCVLLVHDVISSKNVSTNPTSNTSNKDELFIDDFEHPNNDKSEDKIDHDDSMMLAEEGSGMDPATKSTGAEDMESSGSGYGPDDEDAQVNGKTPGKTDDEDDDIDGDDEEEDDLNVNEDFNKEKSQKPTQQVFTTTSTTSSTVRTLKNDDEDSRYIDPTKQKTNVDDVNVAPSDVLSTTSTSTVIPPPSNAIDEHSSSNGVYISPNSHPERTSSFFAQPGILAAVIGGAVVGLLCAILVVMFIVYRMRKKDEGSYPLEETKRSPATNPYLKSTHREFYA